MATVIVVAALLALGLGRGAQAATLTVVNTNDSGAGSLRQAIANAAPGDTIDFNAGLSGQTITLTSGELLISKNLTITGPVVGVTISGNNASRVFEIIGGVTVNMSFLTVSSGFIGFPQSGGGIHNDGGVLTLTNSTISGNSADGGGGGIYNNDTGTLTLTNSTISGNVAPEGSGGGILNLYSGRLAATSSTISGNIAVSGGGGIDNGGIATLTNSAITGNSASSGGGISTGGVGTLTITNSTISGNSASFGGGIANDNRLTLINSTISGNRAFGGPGGIWDAEGSAGLLTMMNTIVAKQSQGGDCTSTHHTIVSLGYNLDSDGSCNLTATGDLPNTNPMLDPLALNPPGTTQTHALQPGSPAIDHIPPSVNGCGTAISTDQRGVSRPQGGGCDIGAYELAVPPTPIPTPAPVGGIVALPVSGSGSRSLALPIALVGGAVMVVGWYRARRWLR